MRDFVFFVAVSMIGCNATATPDSSAGGAGVSSTSASGGAGGQASSTTQSTNQVASTAASGTTSSGVTPSGLSVLVEPGAGIQPLVDAINGAHASVHMTMYLLTSNDVIDALVAAHQAGREVKVVLNQTFPSSGNLNASAYATLSSGGVDVVYAPATFTYTHEKCVIIDGNQAWIMTMNATVSSATDNREYLAIDDNAADVTEAEAIFQADFTNKAITPTGALVVAPTNAESRLVAFIETAQQSLKVEDEELSDTSVVQALDNRADQGVKVDVVLSDVTPTAAETQAITKLKQHGVKIVVLSSPYIHAKAIVVDGASVYVGSENLTYNSLAQNRELGLITTVAAVVSTIGSTISEDFANGTAQ